MDVTVVVLCLTLLVLYVCVYLLNKHVDALEGESDSLIHGFTELMKKVDACVAIQDEQKKQLEEIDKRLDKFEYAVERTESDVDFTSGVDAILSYNAHDALKEAKKELVTHE